MPGYPEYAEEGIYNAAAVLCDGETVANYRKQELPNYSVFDEKRYFEHGLDTCIFELKGIRIALLICEDIWEPNPRAPPKRTARSSSSSSTARPTRCVIRNAAKKSSARA